MGSGGGGGPVNMSGRGAPSGMGSNIYHTGGSISSIGPMGLASGPMYGGDRFDAYKQPLGPMGRKF